MIRCTLGELPGLKALWPLIGHMLVFRGERVLCQRCGWSAPIDAAEWGQDRSPIGRAKLWLVAKVDALAADITAWGLSVRDRDQLTGRRR